MLTHTILVMNSEAVEKLSTTEIKELLYQRNIDSAGIYDRYILLGLLLGKNQETDYRATLPPSYLKLFEVCGSFCFFLFQQEDKRNEEALSRIKSYLQKPIPKKERRVRIEYLKCSYTTFRKVDRLIIYNMPSRYTKSEIGLQHDTIHIVGSFLSRAGEVEAFEVLDPFYLYLLEHRLPLLIQYSFNM